MKLSDFICEDSHTQCSRLLSHAFSIHAAVFFGYIAFRTRQHGGEVRITMGEIECETALSPTMQRSARRLLGGIIKTREVRLEHQTFYSIDRDALERAILAFEGASISRSQETSLREKACQETSPPEVRKPDFVNREEEEHRGKNEEDLVPSARHADEPQDPNVACGQDLPASLPPVNGHAQQLPAAHDVPRAKERPVRERNPAWDALASLEGVKTADHPNRLASGAIGKALKCIRESCPDTGTQELAAEIERRAENYRRQWPHVTLSAMSLARHWARCDKAPSGPANGKARLEREGQSKLSEEHELRWEELGCERKEEPCRR